MPRLGDACHAASCGSDNCDRFLLQRSTRATVRRSLLRQRADHDEPPPVQRRGLQADDAPAEEVERSEVIGAELRRQRAIRGRHVQRNRPDADDV